MPDWQERITRETAPSIRVEHELRYAAAAPLVHASAAWCDLGCGTGLGAAAGLGVPYAGTALLVDADEAAVEQARTTVAAHATIPLTADLTSPTDLARVRDELTAAAADGRRAVTCFEVIEHLTTFVPLVELLVELAEHHDTSVVASVPNDAFWSIENPHHVTTWGEGAVEELRSLLPADHVFAHQVALQGSALARAGETAEEVASIRIGEGVATHFLLAFGPGADQLATAPRVVQADLAEQRRWERQRESDLRFMQAMSDQLEQEIERVAEFRTYIHELEERLGLPRAGETPAGAPGDAP
jgi:2-polyprenyl-3-methyl-5-hydroxy-6-metoxy-1,4-benzoquinol methylase